MSFYIKIQSIGCLFVDKYFGLRRHHTDIPPTSHWPYIGRYIGAQDTSHWLRVNRYSVKHDTVLADMLVDTQRTIDRYVNRLLTIRIDQVSVDILADTIGRH